MEFGRCVGCGLFSRVSCVDACSQHTPAQELDGGARRVVVGQWQIARQEGSKQRTAREHFRSRPLIMRARRCVAVIYGATQAYWSSAHPLPPSPPCVVDVISSTAQVVILRVRLRPAVPAGETLWSGMCAWHGSASALHTDLPPLRRDTNTDTFLSLRLCFCSCCCLYSHATLHCAPPSNVFPPTAANAAFPALRPDVTHPFPAGGQGPRAITDRARPRFPSPWHRFGAS